MSLSEEALLNAPPLLTGEPKGIHDAACIESYLSLGIPERSDKWKQYDLATEDGRAAHATFVSLLGIAEPTFETDEPEPIQPGNFSLPSGAFLTRQAFIGDDTCLVFYRAHYA